MIKYRKGDLMSSRRVFKREATEFHNKCVKLSHCARIKSELFYYINHLCSFIIIISGAAIGVLSVFEGCSGKLMTSLGFILTALKVAVSIYSPEKKSVQLKMISQSLNKLSRDIKRLGTLTIDPKSLQDRLEQYREEFDSLDLGMYDVNTNSRLVSLLSGKDLDMDEVGIRSASNSERNRRTNSNIGKEDIIDEDPLTEVPTNLP